MKCHVAGVVSLQVLFSVLLVIAVATSPACGGPHTLQSITVNPQSAAANGSAVQFIATGNYNASPLHVTPEAATWGACKQNVPTNEVTVTGGGLARCASGAAGSYTVFAFVNTNPTSCRQTIPSSQCGTGPCIVTGTAQLTCP